MPNHRMRRYRVFMAGFEEFERIPLPQPGVFIAHDFSGRDKSDNKSDAPRQVEDYRLAYEDGLRDAGYIPVYAPVHAGTILQTLCKEMINTDAGIFDVSFGREYNANVLIELGISLGINHPTLVVAEEKDKPLLDFLEVLNPLYYQDDNDLSERIGKVIGERINDFDKRISRHFCVICQMTDCRCRKGYPQEEKRYLLVGADEQASILRDMKQVAKTFQIEPLEITDDHNTQLCNWLYHIRKSRFVLLYSQELGKRHHGAENAKTMVQLGMAIGAGIPWRIMLNDDENVPTDVTGYIDIRIMPTHTLTRSNLEGAIGALRDINMPYLGIEDILPMGEWVEEDEELSIDMPFSGIPMSPMINVPPEPLNIVLDEAEIKRVKALLLSNPTEPIILDSVGEFQGIGGIGKTTLAVTVCYQPDVREYFDLGICWIDGSKNAGAIAFDIYDITEKIQGEPITRLGGIDDELDTLRFAVESFGGYLRQKPLHSRVLVVVDDIQDAQIAQVLSALATPQSVVLFTTRDVDILASHEADVSSKVSLNPSVPANEYEKVLEHILGMRDDDLVALYDNDGVLTHHVHKKDAYRMISDNLIKLAEEKIVAHIEGNDNHIGIQKLLEQNMPDVANELYQDYIRQFGNLEQKYIPDILTLPARQQLEQLKEKIDKDVKPFINFSYTLNNTTKTASFKKTEIIIGRTDALSVDLDLTPDRETSRRHARVYYERGRWWLEDLSSSYGTYHYNERIVAPVQLRMGSRIRIGQTDLIVDFETNHSKNTPKNIPTIRVFLSSPGDVDAERKIAVSQIEFLANSNLFKNRVHIEIITWDNPRYGAVMSANLSPQEAVNRYMPRPSECDIAILIFWSRMGTPTIIDGQEYISGIHFELLNALDANVPTIIYRRTTEKSFDIDDEEAIAQYSRVRAFFSSDLFYKDGKAIRGVNGYTDPIDFQTRFEQHFIRLVEDVLQKQNT